MKIKTITCHNVYNFGASLQAYALMTYLQNEGYDAEIIDYKPDYLSKHYKFDVIGNPVYEKNILLKYAYLFAKFPGRYKAYKGLRKKRFDEFTKNHLKTTDIRYTSNEMLKDNLPNADIFIAGSDQIWNTNFNNGKDPSFYLDFVPNDKIKASYAASFSIDSLPEEYKENIKRMISNLDYVSVREKKGLNILKDLGIENAVQVMDPVFLLSKKEWNLLEEKSQIKNFNEKYLICYDFDGNELVKEICLNIAKKNNLKIYSFFKNNYANKCFYNIGPIEFLSLIKNSEYVVSNSFHGTAFALIYEKEFLVVNRKEKLNSRMLDLLSLFGLKERMISEFDNRKELLSIDYALINKFVEEEVNKAKTYLENVVK